MKKRKHTLKSIVALGLTAVMLVNTIPLEAFAAGEEVSVEDPADDTVIDDKDEIITEDDIITDEENSDAAVVQPAFEESQTIDGVEYVVSATDEQELTWRGLQAQFDNASTERENPTTITLTNDVTAGEDDTALVILENRYVTLDLNGNTINRGLSNVDAVEGGNVITVNGNLTLTDSSTDHTGTITGGNNEQPYGGGGVLVNSGTFTMSGGTITNCKAGIGGGVCVTGNHVKKGMFIMESGTITGCNAVEGGGVYVDKNGTFNMDGGTISDCTAIPPASLSSGGMCLIYGGGVYVDKNGTFNMDGGTISACTASSPESPSDGVTYKISGGGVYVNDNDTFNISGAPVISGNKIGNDANNVVLESGKTITVTGELKSGAEIYVYADKEVAFAKDDGNYNITDTDLAKFHSDKDSSLVAAEDSDGVKFFTPWRALQAKFNNASTGAGSPTRITLTGDVTAGEGDTALVIPAGKYVTLDLNGHTIDRGLAGKDPAENGSVIRVEGNLTLSDNSTGHTGKINGGNNGQASGGGVYVKGGTFTMEGGTITGCNAALGGGVSVDSGTFTMTGGTITDCNAYVSGGGVYVKDGTFTMTGGTITDCNANLLGGGVSVDSGTFTMENGTITGCKAKNSGGGVYNHGTFNMSDGTITDCSATGDESNGGGVYIENLGTFKVSGTPVISGNMKGSTIANNVELGGKTISVNGALTSGAEIRVNAGLGVPIAQKGGDRIDDLTVDELGYFKSDLDPQYKAGLNENSQVVFKTALPAIANATDLTYNGTEQEPELKFYGVSLTAGTDYTVSYKKVVGSTETVINGAPKDVGSYKAVAAGKGSYAGTSEASFTIAPKPVTVGGIKAKNKVYDTTTTAELDCSGATFAGKVDGDRLTVSGTGTFENANAGKGKTVTITGLTLGGESKDNYVLAEDGNQKTTTATITRATPEVTAPTASATYMENLSNVTLTNPDGNMSGTWNWATDNGINPNETAVGTVGTHVFRAKFTPEDTVNYCETTEDVTVTVGKAKPHLTIESFSALYGHLVSVKITCDSDGKVTYVFYKSDGKTKTNTEDGAETEGGAPKNAGTYNIVASVAETSNYLSWEETLANGCVITPAPNPAVLRSTVTVRRGSDYDLSGLVSGVKGTVSFALKESKDGYSLSGSTLTLGSNAADSCTITVTADGTVDGKSNYETFSGVITVNATDLLPQDSFGFADVAQEKTYGDGDFTVAATGEVTGSNVTYSSDDPAVATVEAETGKVHILKAGTATITATAGETATYASATASYKLTVNPKPVTISGITANDMVYNSTIGQVFTLNTAGAKIDGMVDGDVLTVKEAIGMCEEADAGKNKTVTILRITLGGSSAGNYTVDLENSQKTTTINITKANIPDTAITAPTGKNGLVYTGLAQSLVDAGTALGGEMRYALGTATDAPADTLYSASIPVAVNAGSYYVWYMVKGDRNHNDSSSNGPVTVTIEKASDGTINADAVELQKGDNIEASVNIRGYVGTGANITGTSQVMPDNDPGIQITDINVSNDNLTFKVSSANGGNAIITVTLTSDNYADVTLTIPVKVQAKTTEVKLDPPATGVESSVESVTAGGLDDYTDSLSGESVKVVLDVKPVNEPQGSAVKTKIDNSVKAIFKGVEEGDLKTEYLDISITKQIGTGAANPVGDVGRVLELAIRYDLNGKFHPVVIREHEGTVTAFTALNAKPNENYQDGTFYVDKDHGIIYIYSRYFSTYSIAYATVNSHTVSFDAKGGSSVDPIIVADGGMIDPLPSSSMSGYSFEGWYSSTSESGIRLTTETVINGDVTYYARWKENTTPPTPPTPPAPAATYTVSFDMNGKEATDVPKTQKVKEGKCALEPAAEPKAEGFKFAGWYREAECENRFNFSEPILADTVVYAKWIDAEVETFTVHFDLNGKAGTAPSPQIVEKGKTATRPVQDPMARGFRFTDWYTEPECTGLYDFGTPVTADITLYAGWKEDAAIVVESSEVWNLYEDASVHEYEIHGISVSGTVSNSNAKSKDYYDAKISGSTITVSVTGDRKKAAANATLKFNLGKDGVIEYELPVSYVKPGLKLSTNAATIRKGTETVLKTTLLVKNEEGSYEPYDMTDVTVSGDGLGTVTKAADGSIEIRTSAAGKGKISIVKNSWDSASPVSLSYTVKGSSKDVLSVDLGGLKTVVVNSNAKGQSFSFDVTLNGATVTAADATDDTDAADTPAVTLIDKKNTGLASISEDGKLVIAYKDGVKKGSYTITLQSGDANTNVKIRVSDKALDKAVTAKVKTKYDVVTGQGMVVVPKLKEVSGSITGVSVAESGFTAKLNAAGDIVIDYSGDKYDAKNLKIGMLTLTLTISGLENPVTVELKNVKAKKTTPKAKVAVVTIPTDAPEAADKVIGTANIVSTYKDSAGMVKTIKPVKAEILDTPKGVEAKVNESDLSEIDIYGLSKKSVSFKVKLTYAGGVTKTVTVKAKRK